MKKTILKFLFALGFILLASAGQVAAKDDGPCYTEEGVPVVDSICLVIDRSGSMAGKALKDAKAGAKDFVKNVKPGTAVAIITFSDSTEMALDFTEDRKLLAKTIDGITVKGNTALNDAIAFAALKLQGRESRKIIVFLTDGKDNRSRYTLNDISKMNISEGIFVYGIAMGDVDKNALAGLCGATGGKSEYTKTSVKLKTLYPQTLKNYYTRGGKNAKATGFMVVKSLPDNRPVLIDGKKRGMTPLSLSAMTPGTYSVEVAFESGKAACSVPVTSQKKTLLDLRAPEKGRDLRIVTTQSSVAVYFDGAYMGPTGSRDKTLTIVNAPPGEHTVRLVCMPDFDYGPEQVMEIPLTLTEGRWAAEIKANILQQKVLDTSRVDIRFKTEKKKPFSQLDDESEE
jgi:hypothetical protein